MLGVEYRPADTPDADEALHQIRRALLGMGLLRDFGFQFPSVDLDSKGEGQPPAFHPRDQALDFNPLGVNIRRQQLFLSNGSRGRGRAAAQ